MYPRRRFYKGPVTSLAAGKEERVMFHRGKICVRQLNLWYDGDDTTGSYSNIWKIKIDGQEILNMTLYDIFTCLAGYVSAGHSDRPVVVQVFNNTSKTFGVIFHDLGVVNEGIEVWFKNVDTSNSCSLIIAMVYDVLE